MPAASDAAGQEPSPAHWRIGRVLLIGVLMVAMGVTLFFIPFKNKAEELLGAFSFSSEDRWHLLEPQSASSGKPAHAREIQECATCGEAGR